MPTNKYVKQIYRALVVGCMVYAVTLIADTAAAAEPKIAVKINSR